MELINTLIVKSFPWVKDWTYKFSQDTIIEWDWGTWKTSLLKAITWLFTEKDLQWKTIPNITSWTIVTSRWCLELSRTKSKWLRWDLYRILSGSVDEILSRIIPGYIFSWWISNKKVAEMLTWIKIEEQCNHEWFNLSTLTNKIKEHKQSQFFIQNISTYIYNLTNSFSTNIIDKKNLNSLIDIEWLMKFQISFDKFRLEFHKLRWPYVSSIPNITSNTNDKVNKENLIKREDKLNKSKEKILKSIKDNLLKDLVTYWFSLPGLWTGITQEINNAYSSMDNIVRIVNNELWKIHKINWLLNKDIIKYYNKTFQNLKTLYTLIQQKEQLTTRIYKNINNKLKWSWITLSNNNILEVKVEHKWKTRTIQELPSHIKFLVEISICSRLQLDYIVSNGRRTDLTWLILIDDYRFKDDEDSTDELLIEALNNQVIITKTESWTNELVIGSLSN